MSNEIALLIPTCDAFADILPGNILSLRKFWPEFDEQIYAITDKEPKNPIPGVNYIVAGDLEYSDRLKYGLEHIESEYVLVCLDDYYINRYVDNQKFKKLLTIVKSNDIDYLRLFTKSWPEEQWFDESLDLKWIDLSYHRYKVNLYIGIWRRETMIKVCTGSLPPWQFEVSLTEKMEALKARCLTLNKEEVISIADVVRKGRITRDTYKYVKRNGLYTGDRKKQKLSNYWKLHMMDWYKGHASKKSQTRMKKFLKKLGFKFYSDWNE